ncbi:hypothetical protein MMC07_005487 [Pseudocyphellaria aurata]|nr:hypothetical protein [Pseudocyphellaria aurata]
MPAKPPSSTMAVKASSMSLSRPSAPQLQNTGSSALLGLPLEVRRSIYIYALTFSPISGNSELEGGCTYVPGDKRYASLLRVCRQIYREACLLPFQINLFRIGIGPDGLSISSLLCSTMESWQAKELRNVELIVSELLLKLPFFLDLFNGLLGCKYLSIKIKGKLNKRPNINMFSKFYGFQAIAPNLERLRIAYEDSVCHEVLKGLEKDLMVILPKVHIVVLSERTWLHQGTRH